MTVGTQQRLMFCTRKGLFELRCVGTAYDVRAIHFPGEPVTQFHRESKSGAWFAALNLGHFGVKLRKSTDEGETWTEAVCPAFPEKPNTAEWSDDPTPWSVGHIWALADDGAGTLWAGCMPAGLFRSRDGGDSWQLVRPLWFQAVRKTWIGGGNDHAGIHTILIDPRNPQHVTIAVSCAGLWATKDGGETWRNIGNGQRAGHMPPEKATDPGVQDPHRVALCISQPNVWWMQNHFGLYRSEDAGENWSHIESAKAHEFGFPIVADPRNPQRAWMVPTQADTHRYAPDGAMSVARTDDGGRTWTQFRNGLPQRHAYHLIYRHNLALADDGTTMAMGSTTGGVWISGDAGETWAQVDVALPLVSAVSWV
jgi:hypothetical protein